MMTNTTQNKCSTCQIIGTHRYTSQTDDLCCFLCIPVQCGLRHEGILSNAGRKAGEDNPVWRCLPTSHRPYRKIHQVFPFNSSKLLFVVVLLVLMTPWFNCFCCLCFVVISRFGWAFQLSYADTFTATTANFFRIVPSEGSFNPGIYL